jgi:DNA-binding NarL/FixJ family response regulator
VFDPTYTEEQSALVDTARKFTRDTIIPNAHEYDEKEEFPLPIFQAAFDLGLMNVEMPEAYGGLGLHTLDGCLVAEELAYGCPAVATSVLCNHLGALPLLIAGTRGAEAAVPDVAHPRAGVRQLLLQRAGGGQRRGGDEDPVDPRRRRLAADRAEAVDHQRRPREASTPGLRRSTRSSGTRASPGSWSSASVRA